MKFYTYYNLKNKLAALQLVVFTLLLASCSPKQPSTVISGEVTGAKGELLVLVHMTDGQPQLIDTLRLDSIGKFSFKVDVEDGPDFFALNLGMQSISLVVDTLHNPVHVTVDAEKFGNGYTVDDEWNKELKSAIMVGNRLRRQMMDVSLLANDGKMSNAAAQDSLIALVANYKQTVLTNYIFDKPASPASYYLLFETVRGLKLFDANDPQDVRAFGAVATNWEASYPNSPRNTMLKKMTIEGQQYRRLMAQRAQQTDSIVANTKIEERTFPEVTLTNADDREVSLSSLVDGKSVVLVDYTAYYFTAFSPAHNMVLGRLYEQYADKGLKIYQICLDFDENFWKVSADNLPWTTVRDRNVSYFDDGTIDFAPSAVTYNVRSVPTTFIIGRDGELKTRIEMDDEKLETEVKKYMK
ncbi:MAG: redoxin domain-containing protein [Bacteroidales bacterium]|nr:redoxin domain-containing protein [Candidatus Liminaster caballi]